MKLCICNLTVLFYPVKLGVRYCTVHSKCTLIGSQPLNQRSMGGVMIKKYTEALCVSSCDVYKLEVTSNTWVNDFVINTHRMV